MFPTRYADLSLSGKLLVPLLLTTTGMWGVAAFCFGYVQTSSLERGLEKNISEFAVQVEQNFAQRVKILELKARSITEAANVGEAMAQADRTKLLQILLPLQTSLDLDLVRAISLDGEALIDLKEEVLANSSENSAFQAADRAAINGLSFTTALHQPGHNVAALVRIIPAKNENGITGSILFGTALDQTLLTELQADSSQQLVLLKDSVVVASTLLENEAGRLRQQPGIYTVTADDKEYLAAVIDISDGIEADLKFIVLHPTAEVTLAKHQFWRLAGCLAVAGAGLTSGIGIGVIRMATHRLTTLTQATQKIAAGDFTTTVNVDGKDEVGHLATGFNIMVKQVNEREQRIRDQISQLEHTLKELEKTKDQLIAQEKAYSRTLESEVEERTSALTATLSELQDTQSQLIQTEKMASLGQMVAGIAHEINNPISFIHGNLNPLQESVEDVMRLLQAYQGEYPQPSDLILKLKEDIDLDFLTEDISRIVDSMKIGTQRVKAIVVSLRNYSRLDESATKSVDIHEGLDSTLLILNHRLKHGIEVVKDYGELPNITCSPAQLNQVYTNIISNAIDAMLEADCAPKQLYIGTRTVALDQVQIIIKDNGVGIPADLQHKIFDPFFTTKGVGKGTGLGLGICYKIIRQHQGDLAVISEVGKGTEFRITLFQNMPSDSLSPS